MTPTADDPKFSGGDYALKSVLIVGGYGHFGFGAKAKRLAIYLFVLRGILSLKTNQHPNNHQRPNYQHGRIARALCLN